MRTQLSLLAAFTLITSSLSWSQSGPKVVLQDMGNVGFRISDAQSLANWVSNGLAQRVGHENVAYEGLLKSKKDLARRLGNTEIHPTQAADIERLEAFVQGAQVWVKARFGKNKKGHWVDLSCRKSPGKKRKATEEKRLYAATFHDLQPAVRESLRTFCSALLPSSPAVPARAQPGSAAPGRADPLPPKKPAAPKKWLPPTRR